MRAFRKIYPELSHHRLCDAIEYFTLEGGNAHRALNDCYYTLQAFNHLKDDALNRFTSYEEYYDSFKRYKNHKRIDLTCLTAECEPNEDSPLYGKVCVFTGELEKFSRVQAAQIVVNIGGICANGVTKKTNFLILGNNDYCSQIKDGKSNKQKKAEEYLTKGYDIAIISETEFYELLIEE